MDPTLRWLERDPIEVYPSAVCRATTALIHDHYHSTLQIFSCCIIVALDLFLVTYDGGLTYLKALALRQYKSKLEMHFNLIQASTPLPGRRYVRAAIV